MNTKLKCIVKDCNKKVLIKLQSTDLENTSIQFFKMCKKHQLDFNNKVKEIKEYYDNKIKNNDKEYMQIIEDSFNEFDWD